jgi:hypothetical protein
MPGWSQTFPAGVRSPPLREMAKRRREGLTGANPEMARKAVFSEGRTLCVRVARPDASRGIPFPPGDEARGRLAYRAHASVKPVPSYPGVRSPPLREMAKRRGEGLTGANPEMTRKAVFSEGRTLCVRIERLGIMPRHLIPTDPLTKARWPSGDMPGGANAFPRACGARPSRGGRSKGRWPYGANPEMTRKAVFSEGRTLCVREYGSDASRGIT